MLVLGQVVFQQQVKRDVIMSDMNNNDTQSIPATKTTKRRKRHYVGVVGDAALEVFTALAKSDEAKPAKYPRVFGPFNTAKGANYLVKYHTHFDLNAKTLPMQQIE